MHRAKICHNLILLCTKIKRYKEEKGEDSATSFVCYMMNNIKHITIFFTLSGQFSTNDIDVVFERISRFFQR